MKKKLIILFALLFVSISLFSATEGKAFVLDGASLLSSSEKTALEEMLSYISANQSMDIVVATTDTFGDSSARAFADDLYDNNNYGYGIDKDGILLLVGMSEHEYYISTSGLAISFFSDSTIRRIGDEIAPLLTSSDYYDAFTKFASLSNEKITREREKLNTTTTTKKEEVFSPSFLLLAFSLSFIISLIIVIIMKGKLKSVKTKNEADDYIKRDSFNLTKSNDMFLYHTITRTEIPKENSSTHTSSSGRTHGGGGGKF